MAARLLAFTLFAGLVLPAAAPLRAQGTSAAVDPGLALLRSELERLAELAGGVVGASVIHLQSSRELHLHGDEPFPMASSYKVPIAIRLLERVDRGEVRLDRMVELLPSDLHPGSGTLSELFDDPGVILSLRNLLELMLQISDNSATDLVLREAGGSAAVSSRMGELGFGEIRVDRPTVDLIADFSGVTGGERGAGFSLAEFEELAEALSEEERERARRQFDADPRDVATPRAMAGLLAALWRRQVLSEESSALLLDILRRCTTGEKRLKGMLPPGTEVSHKTGTVGGTTNDVGIIHLPDGAGDVVAAIFVKQSELEVEEREAAIAQLARAIYDYFLFSRAGAE